MNSDVIKFLQSLPEEVNVEFDSNDNKALSHIRRNWRYIYDHCNGISSPFFDVYSQENIDNESVEGWIKFGFDGYFTFLLLNKNGGEKFFDFWGH